MASKTQDKVGELIRGLKSKESKKKKAAKKTVTQEVWPDVKKIKDDVEKNNVLDNIYESIKHFFQHPVESTEKKHVEKEEKKKYKNLAKATKKTLPDILVKHQLTPPQRKKLNEILA